MMVQAVAQGEDVPFHIKNVSQSVGSAATGSPTATLDLKTDLNTHFKKTHTTTINGKTVYVSGVFDNEQNAFMSVWVEGDAKPQILNIAGLLEAEGSVTIGGKEHAVEIQANPLKPKRSRINIYDPNGDEESAIRLGSLLNKIQAAGLAIKIGGTDYRIFYTDGVGDGPKLDPTKRLFSIITTDAEGDIHVFLVLESLVPSDKIAVFKVLNDKRLGLKQVNGKLEIYDNP
ncbi:MAG: hypothetical protein COB53_00660 [Elusimicrobia bacterium]|nr:MAG: hypothetical protein COB53_00660 [Elusimicrobiota bacterium]